MSDSGPAIHEHFDVVIVGCGPVGMVLAGLLTNQGVKVLALERQGQIGHRPRARHLDGEAMRILQTIGVAEASEAIMSAFGGGLRLVAADGDTLMEQRFDATRRGNQGWYDDYQMFQPLLLRVLQDHLEASETGSLRTTCEVTAVSQDDAGVRVTIHDHDRGADEVLGASWVVGCDGAGSMIRGQMGTSMVSLGPEHPFVVLDALPRVDEFELPDGRFSRLVCDPYRPHYASPGNGAVPMRFEFMVLPGDDADEMVSPAGIERLTAGYVTPGEVSFERASVYVFHSLLAADWRVGRILLAGDAAHVQPPFMGQGLCSGFRDTSNLAWKLGMVCRGEAGEELLDTYGSERAPHARDWINEANRIGAIVMTTDAVAARERDERIRAGASRELRPIAPRLGPGLVAGTGAPVGTLAPQPTLSDGRRLDDLVGYRFAVAVAADLWAALPVRLRAAVEQAPSVSVLDPESDGSRELLAHYGTRSLIVRPDRYVLSATDEPADLERDLLVIPGVRVDFAAIAGR